MKIYIYWVLNIIFSIMTCFILRPTIHKRGLMHFPFGVIGSIFIEYSQVHGLVFMFLLCLYQILEFYSHIRLRYMDLSWIDIEGYCIGFVYTIITLLLQKRNQHTIYEDI